MHSNHLIHREIKPSNIFMEFQGNAKLTDYGLSKFIGNQSSIQKECKKALKIYLLNDGITQILGALQCVVRTKRFYSISGTYKDNSWEIGTPAYLALEQINHEKYDEKVDIYSLGIVFYLLLMKYDTSHERSTLLSE